MRQKLIEEAQEAAEANEELITELADLYEVIDALMETYGIKRELVLAEQERRRSDMPPARFANAVVLKSELSYCGLRNECKN